MADQIQKIVTGLPDLKNVSGVWAVADERVARGDAAFAADLGIALARTYRSAEQMWQYRTVFDHLLQLLTTTGPENVAQALRMVSSAEVTDRKLDRYTASLLASSHTAEDLAVAFTGRASEELRACLVHELVLRRAVVEETPGIADWATSPHWSHHPLRWLPPALSEMERGADLPTYGIHGSSHTMPYDDPSESRPLAVLTDAEVPSAEETTTQATAVAMGHAVANWAEESNGRMEARVFVLADPLEARSVPNALLRLGLECLRGAGKRTPLSVAVHPPAEAWRVLFAAASTGGAYNSGSYGAYGRLAAWQSLAALAGSPVGATAGEVEARVRGCVWHGFRAGTEWFEHVAWDIGLAALAPGRRRLAVLAATDTD
ncbi:DUF6183 family protein [Streptomyces sp. NPDC127112]|uniref:DUF6183 family protein n=1 Tax=Streptomyces sp. NPDC127112 TaxID=3345364 RepID=UPI003637E2B5